MSGRGARRYVEDLLRGRRPRPFRASDEDAAEVRAAIGLRAARPGSGAPDEEFVAGLHQRLAAELDASRQPEPARESPPPSRLSPSRRRVVQVASVAAAALAAGGVGGAALERSLVGAATAADGDGTLDPNIGKWHTVAASADLIDGAVRSFDVGTVTGFVLRAAGALHAVSGVCTHQGCLLALDRPSRELICPCHNATFALSGELVRHQLSAPPAALPRIPAREVDGAVQVFAAGRA